MGEGQVSSVRARLKLIEAWAREHLTEEQFIAFAPLLHHEDLNVYAEGERWTFTGSDRTWHRIRDAILNARRHVMANGGGVFDVRNRAGAVVEKHRVPGR